MVGDRSPACGGSSVGIFLGGEGAANKDETLGPGLLACDGPLGKLLSDLPVDWSAVAELFTPAAVSSSSSHT